MNDHARAELAPDGKLRVGLNYGNFLLVLKDAPDGSPRWLGTGWVGTGLGVRGSASGPPAGCWRLPGRALGGRSIVPGWPPTASRARLRPPRADDGASTSTASRTSAACSVACFSFASGSTPIAASSLSARDTRAAAAGSRFQAPASASDSSSWTRSARASSARSSRTDGGAIVAVGSVNSWRGDRNLASYAASKHAVLGLVRSFALDLGRRGIRVNALGPGPIATDALLERMRTRERERGIPVEDALAGARAQTALGRIATIDEVAAAALFLSSDLSSGITGHLLPVDAGLL